MIASIIIVAFAGALLAACVRQVRTLRWPLLLLLALLLLAPLSGELMLALMKLQVLELTKSLLSYVAKVTNANGLINYFCGGLLLLTALVYLLKVVIPRRRTQVEPRPIEHRKAVAHYQNSRRVLVMTLVLAVISAGSQLYWDKIASQPRVYLKPCR